MEDACIEVKVQSKKLSWTWHDGTSYAITASIVHADRPSYWQVVKEDKVIGSRQVIYPTWRKSLAFFRDPQTNCCCFKWELENQIVFEVKVDYGCLLFPCFWSLRHSDGKRLASWRARKKGGFEGAWPNTWHSDLSPILFGMILAEIHDRHYC